MKYDEIKLVESTVSLNDYVVSDVKPRKSALSSKLRRKQKSGKISRPLSLDAFDIALIPVVICAAISLGFLIVQVVKVLGIDNANAFLSMI